MEIKLNKDKFVPLFGDYWPKFEKFFDKGGFEPIYEYLKSESNRNKRIAPNSSLTYRCFTETPLKDLKLIICAFCPYHTFTREGISIADGLAMSCEVTGKLQPSLDAWYSGLEEELSGGMDLNYYRSPSLKYLASQGILLFNSGLTVSEGKPGSHGEIWREFTKFFFEEVVGYTGIPVIFLGAEAAKFEKYVTPFTHVFSLKHPAYYARLSQPFDTEGVIKKVNKIIHENNSYRVQWLCSKEEIEEITADLPF